MQSLSSVSQTRDCAQMSSLHCHCLDVVISVLCEIETVAVFNIVNDVTVNWQIDIYHKIGESRRRSRV